MSGKDRARAEAPGCEASPSAADGVFAESHPSRDRLAILRDAQARSAAEVAVDDALAALMPTEQDAIRLMHDAYTRLKKLGWNDAIYCPKDGTEFDAIEVGSTGIHPTCYHGEWPDGGWWVADGGDLWLSKPVLYRVAEAEKQRWADVKARFKAPCSTCGKKGLQRIREDCRRSDCPYSDSDGSCEADETGTGSAQRATARAGTASPTPASPQPHASEGE